MISQWPFSRARLFLAALSALNAGLLVAGIELDIGSDGAYV